MRFIDQGNRGQSNWGTYLLSVAFVFIGVLVGNLLSEYLSNRVLGHSLLHIQAGSDKNTVLILMLIPFITAFIHLLLAIRYFHRQPLRSIFTMRDKLDLKRFFFAFTVWGAILGSFLTYDVFNSQDLQWNLNWEKFLPLLMISLFIIPIQTTFEEVLFRGLIFQGLGRYFKPALFPIIISAVLFGALHGANPEVYALGYGVLVYYVVTGLFFAIVTHMDDGLELSMGYHAVNNIFGTLILTNNWQSLQTEAMFVDTSAPSFDWISIITLILIQPLLILLFAKVYKWKNWKQKLFGGL